MDEVSQDLAEHFSVMKSEALAHWRKSSNEQSGIFIDATYGRGGHTQALINQLGGEVKGQTSEIQSKLLVIDKDPKAIAHAKTVSQPLAEQAGIDFFVRHASFAATSDLVETLNWTGKVSGVLLDLGVSSPQLDEAERGFSFLRNGPLDMRMDTSQGISAAEWIATAAEVDIRRILWNFGEEKYGRRIARAIVNHREQSPITTTKQLADLVASSVPKKEHHKHPATRSFQAIRIFINKELEDLQQFLSQVLSLLEAGGRLVVISFHSLEDRIVKRFMQKEAKGDPFPRDMPVRDADLNRRLKILVKGEKPDDQEIEVNSRSRSAVLRVAEKF